MLGFFDYTCWLTYLSLLSAGSGILLCLNDDGHPYIGIFFLMFSGLCDAFDGKVARTKKNRSDVEKNFGIQIDSLTDVVAFGVLPACIGYAMLRKFPFMERFPLISVFFAIMLIYMLAAMIRLAYFNVMEEERQKKEDTVREYYSGLPVTSSALIFPVILLVHYIVVWDITPIYFAAMLFTAFAFILPIPVKKPKLNGILILVGVGAVIFIALLWLIISRTRL